MLTHIDRSSRAVSAARSHHPLLVAGVAMLSFAGCAVDTDAPESGAATIVTDARDHRGAEGAPMSHAGVDPGTRIVEGSILTLGDNNPAARIRDGVFPTRLSDDPFRRPATIQAVAGELSLTTGAWRDTLGRMASTWAVKAEALPPAQIDLDAQMNLVVREVVAQNAGVDARSVVGEKAPCDLDGELRCADAFVFTVMSFNGEFGAALMPLARHINARATDVRAVSWTPTIGGLAQPGAVTLYGHYDNRLVGVVVYR